MAPASWANQRVMSESSAPAEMAELAFVYLQVRCEDFPRPDFYNTDGFLDAAALSTGATLLSTLPCASAGASGTLPRPGDVKGFHWLSWGFFQPSSRRTVVPRRLVSQLAPPSMAGSAA